jgi:hypothetical protein
MRPRKVFALVAGLAAVVALVLPPPTMATTESRPGSILPADTFLSAMTGGNTVGAPIREERARADGFRHFDTPAMIKRLKQLHVTTYSFGVWDLATDWDDLRLEFLPAAEAAGIDVMVYLVPPSECLLNEQRHLDGRCSRPFKMDYVRWATEIAELSLDYPNLTSWGIDDFLVGSNRDLFTDAYLAEVRAAQEAVNPDLKWYVTMYFYDITQANMDVLDTVVDGVIYPYNGYNNNTIDSTFVEQRLDAALQLTDAADLELVLLVYTGRFLDGIIHPDERYVDDVLQRAKPYVADGRLSGVVAYAAPVEEKQQPSWDYWGHSGNGSLSLSVSNFTSTVDGSFASASQRVEVDRSARRKTLSFVHHDGDEGGSTGYHFKQVLVDGEVVWEQDTVGDARDTWLPTTIDLTDALEGKRSAEITFRLLDKTGVGWWPLDLRIDDVTGRGIKVRDGGFESTKHWQLDRNQPTMQPYIDIYHADRPTRVFNAIAQNYADYQGERFKPVRSPHFPGLEIGPDNRAMYGNGRLEFTVPADTPVPANTCATAWQRVKVDPRSPRYELDFWHADPYQVKYDKYFKQISIDGELVWDRDAGDWWQWFYIQGSELQGPIDVTDFVQGKRSVKLAFSLCTKNAVDELDIEVGVDNVSTVGLGLDNGGFESRHGWTLEPAGPISVAIDIAGRAGATE